VDHEAAAYQSLSLPKSVESSLVGGYRDGPIMQAIFDQNDGDQRKFWSIHHLVLLDSLRDHQAPLSHG
jgi:hypothetical protein